MSTEERLKQYSKPRQRGQPKSEDKRIPLPFRLKTSVVARCRKLGRDCIEKIITEYPGS